MDYHAVPVFFIIYWYSSIFEKIGLNVSYFKWYRSFIDFFWLWDMMPKKQLRWQLANLEEIIKLGFKGQISITLPLKVG